MACKFRVENKAATKLSESYLCTQEKQPFYCTALEEEIDECAEDNEGLV